MDNFKRFNEEKLPNKECFYSSVKDGTTNGNGKKLDGHISDEDYLTCSKIWNRFNMKNIADYNDHYLKKDVLLLTVFGKFIDTCLKFYWLDPCHYFSSLGLSWDAMLNMTGMRLKKFVDIDMYLFIEKGLGGGLSYIAKRYTEANKKCMKDYDPKKPSNFKTYLDMNNSDGWAMSCYLPYDGFKWLKNVNGFDVNSISKKRSIGYIFKVDLKYPDELHVLHNNYPLTPEKLVFRLL